MKRKRIGRLALRVTVVLAVLVSLGVVIPSAYGSSASGSCSNGVVVPSPGSNAGLVSDCETLLAAGDTLSGGAVLDWSDDRAISSWQGVTVNKSLNRVTKLRLPTMGLTGSIPPELAGLSRLAVINLSDNQLTGNIPAEFGGLSRLTVLNVSRNQLTGGIPVELGSLSDLTHLYLHDNGLSGSIPAELGNLSNLTQLYLKGNGLSGSIPAELGNLSNLTHLILQRNGLSGSIPAELGNLSNLTRLNLFGNELSGNIPTELGSLMNLEFLWLGGNLLTGCLPAGLEDVPEGDVAAIGLPTCSSADGPSIPANAAGVELRIVARKLSNGKVEFGLQERHDDGSWSEQVLPARRFFPADAPVGRWLRSSVVTLDG